MVVNAITNSANACRFLPVAVLIINHRLVPGWASVYFLKDFQKLLALFRHLTMSGLALNGARAIEIGRLK